MNSSFHFPDFQKFYKAARECFPVSHDPNGSDRCVQRLIVPSNNSLEECNAGATSTFSSFAGDYSCFSR